MAPMLDDQLLSGANVNSKDLPRLYEDADQSKWQHSANNCLINPGTKFESDIITGSKGLYVYTANGHKVLDWTSGQMSCLIGHGHPEIVETIKSHAENLDHLFSGMLSPPVLNLAKRLTSALPSGLDRAMFLSTGGESNEAAIKMAKVYTGNFEIVGVGASWHGMTAQALGSQYHFGRRGQGPLMPGQHMLPPPNAYRSIFRHPDGSYDWQTELDYGWSLIDRASCGSLAACIVECIQSSAGMHVLPPGYLKALKKHCEDRNMLLIVDEAQTGIGRAGDVSAACHHEGVVPDIITFSKTLGNGLPLSAVVTSHEIERVCTERDFCFYTTHLNDPLPAAVGDKVLEIVQRDDLTTNSKRMGDILHSGLQALMSRYGCIGDVRGRGLMAGVEIVADRKTKKSDNDLARRIAKKIYALGLWANLSSHNSFSGCFRLAPPLVTGEEQMLEGLGIMEKAFAETEGTKPLY